MKKKFTKQIWGWAVYDWANSVFATSLVAVFFPIFFKKYWAEGLPASESTFYLGMMLSFITLVFALLAPFLGSFADWRNFSKKGVLILAFTGSVSCFLFYFVPQGGWFQALLVYSLAWLSFAGSNLFYDSLLPVVAKDGLSHWVSCLGYGLGYLGGGLLLVLNAFMVFDPGFFGLDDIVQATRWIFISVGLWWLFFSLPFLLWVREGSEAGIPNISPAGKNGNSLMKFFGKFPWTRQKDFNFFSGFKQVFSTFGKIKKDRNLLLFLLAYFFYIDGVYTIYKMAVDFALSIGLEPKDLIKAVVIVQFVGFPATLLFTLTERKGVKSGILTGVIIYGFVCFGGMFISTATHFYILATILGLVQGGVQALSRSFYARLIPVKNSGEFFGFYNMFGKFSAVLGPALMGLTSWLTQSPRLSLTGVLILFIVGGFLLRKVEET